MCNTIMQTEKKVGYGLIAMGAMGVQHYNGIQRSHNSYVAAVCDSDPEVLEKARKELHLSRDMCTTDYHELLKNPEVTAVIVSTPDQLHMQATIDALEAGKHVLCEKPMALTVAECAKMVEASERTGNKLMIGQICRYAPGFVMARNLIASGEIGELFFVESEYAHDYSSIPGTGGWRVDPVHLRHPIIGGGIHAIDLLRWIAGNPTELTAYTSRKVLTDWPVDDCFISILKFPEGVLGKVFCSVGCKRSYTMRSVFYGSEGTIIVENTLPYLILYKDHIYQNEKVFEGRLPGVPEQRVEMRIPVKVDSHNTSAEILEFSDLILQGKPVVTNGLEGMRSVMVCNAIVESAARGESVKLNYGD